MPSVQELVAVKTALYTAKVMVLAQGDYICEGQGKRFKARKAHDCALIPQIGDTVLLFQAERCFYILNILERGPVNQHLYHFPGQSVFMMEGNFTQSCHEYKVLSKDCYLQSDRIGLESKRLWTQIDTAAIRAKNMDLKVPLMRRQIQRLYHFVEEFEHNVVGRIRTMVKHCFRMDAEETRLYSKGATKIDGDEIHLG